MTRDSDLTPQLLRQELRNLWFLPLLGAAAALTLIPWHATLDSGSYLRNAHVLFNQQATAAEYLLIREPGLSLLIRGLWATLGRSELYFVAANGALAGLAVALAAATFPEFGGRAQRLAAALLTLLAPVYLVYAGMVLQQIGMAALLSAVCLTLRWITLARPIGPRPLAVLAVLLSAAAYWAALFIYVGVAVAAAVAIWVWRTPRPPTWRRARAALVLSVLAVAVLPWLVMQPWSAWKAGIAEHRTDAYTAQVALEGDFMSRIATGLQEDPAGLVQSRALSTLALLQLEYPLRQVGVDLAKAGPFADSEDLQWASSMVMPEAPCGVLGLTSEGREAVLSWVDLHCRDWAPMGTYARFAEPSYFYGTLASLVLVGFTIWSVACRPPYLVVLAAPWAWLGLYTLAGAAIDRYASPIWPLKTYLVTMLLFAGAGWVVRRLRGSRASSVRAGR